MYLPTLDTESLDDSAWCGTRKEEKRRKNARGESSAAVKQDEKK